MEIDSFPLNAARRWFPSPRRLAAVALVLGCLDTAALLLNMHSWNAGGASILWPANGILLGALLCAPRRHWPAYLTAGFAIDLGVNFFVTSHLWTSAYLASCNTLEAGLAAALLYRTISPKLDLTQRRQLLSLLFYGVILAPAVASFFAQFHSSWSLSWPLFGQRFIADALGIAITTPLYLSFTQQERLPGRSRFEIAGLLAAFCAVTLLVFWQTQLPLLFLLLPFLLLLGVRLRLAGSALGLLIVAMVGGFFATATRGPVILIRPSLAPSRDITLQFFIAASILTLYLIEVLLAERERLQTSLQGSEARFRLLAEASEDVVILSDLSGDRRYVSPAVRSVLGWDPEEMVGQNYTQIVHPDDIVPLASLMETCLEEKPAGTLICRCRRKDGTYIWMEASIRLHRDDVSGKAVGFVNVVRDITNRMAVEEELDRAFRLVENQAMIDGLTGIANRRRFDETMDREWRRAMRDHTPLSLLMIDVDHFKLYNDIYGHISGDVCLREIASAAQGVLHRSSDLLARYGGEEFIVVLPSTDSDGALLLAEQIRSAVELRSLPHSGNPPHAVITVSIGCATSILDYDAPRNSLLQAADDALYVAKSAGRNRIEVAEALPAARLEP
jgi:diguanylate cyclase (GGDEF)-like protein/PAS domain S-box-containing protein